ncbi:MAG: helical backbone metal receptor [Balneolales bacterium]
MKIVSLVPSFTETLFDLDLNRQLAGRTRFCCRPENRVGAIPVIGGTKNPDLRRIKELKPDMVLANKEENRKQDIDHLREFSAVHVSAITGADDALREIAAIGRLLDRQEKAETIVDWVRGEMENIPPVKPATAAYLIWRNPLMTAGGDTYIHDIMHRWGLQNIFASAGRYPVTSHEQIADMKPDYIFLSSEPYPFKDKHIRHFKGLHPDSSVLPVNGQWFSWYGSRMIHAFRDLNKWRITI